MWFQHKFKSDQYEFHCLVTGTVKKSSLMSNLNNERRIYMQDPLVTMETRTCVSACENGKESDVLVSRLKHLITQICLFFTPPTKWPKLQVRKTLGSFHQQQCRRSGENILCAAVVWVQTVTRLVVEEKTLIQSSCSSDWPEQVLQISVKYQSARALLPPIAVPWRKYNNPSLSLTKTVTPLPSKKIILYHMPCFFRCPDIWFKHTPPSRSKNRYSPCGGGGVIIRVWPLLWLCLAPSAPAVD